MISTQFKFIYLHVPKTGGNTIQTMLLPFGDDQKSLGAHRDGIDRFEVSGPVTRHKHSNLQDYSNVLGDRFSDYKIVLSIRHPFKRALSFYFSPHRWFQKQENEEWIVTEPFWDEQSFFSCLEQLKPISDFVSVNGEIQMPDVVLRTEQLQSDFAIMAETLNLPIKQLQTLPHVNKSAAQNKMLERLLQSHKLRDKVQQLFKQDMDVFDFD